LDWQSTQTSRTLSRSRATVRRILAPDGDFLILTQFNPDKPEQRERAFGLVPRFMAWKLATGFVLTAETWLGPERTRSGEEAVLTIGVSQHERMAVIRRIRRTPPISFSPAEGLPADALDDAYFRLLPCGQTTVTAEEAAMLAADRSHWRTARCLFRRRHLPPAPSTPYALPHKWPSDGA
jgi:hypothetical protein